MANILDNVLGSATGLLDFMSHPFQSIILFAGGIILVVIVYKILMD